MLVCDVGRVIVVSNAVYGVDDSILEILRNTEEDEVRCAACSRATLCSAAALSVKREVGDGEPSLKQKTNV